MVVSQASQHLSHASQRVTNNSLTYTNLTVGSHNPKFSLDRVIYYASTYKPRTPTLGEIEASTHARPKATGKGKHAKKCSGDRTHSSQCSTQTSSDNALPLCRPQPIRAIAFLSAQKTLIPNRCGGGTPVHGPPQCPSSELKCENPSSARAQHARTSESPCWRPPNASRDDMGLKISSYILHIDKGQLSQPISTVPSTSETATPCISSASIRGSIIGAVLRHFLAVT